MQNLVSSYFILKTPRVHNVKMRSFEKTGTLKSLPFIKILNNDFKIVVVMKIIVYYL